MRLNISLLGKVEYQEALLLQQRLHSLRVEDKIDDTLLLLEHPPVITMGRRGTWNNILISQQMLKNMGVEVFEITRGGDVTYHGPGQIVGYIIMNLSFFEKDIKRFIWQIEEVFIKLLKDQYGINAYRDEQKYTGVWVDDKKIVAIGIAVKKWITFHGFAFNINTNLNHFNWIVPCGIRDRGVTSLKELLGHEVELEMVCKEVGEYFCKVFNTQPHYVSKEELYKMAKMDVDQINIEKGK